MLPRRSSTVERAFALARDGATSIGQIRMGLRLERCDNVDAHLAGSSIRKDLQRAMATAAAARGT
ncbi:hypothetical protein CKY28_05650 [Sphingomonas lenta]|uniref:Uncharacterized protein n=1 Tax=Sphingomonas lenta TaxID=1141887 RepID=A0A2A2SHY0_9SPHN|nr:hypothetical protein CKY28_05650 [Sphingomonas lenta]